jgi:hypothetical protein
MAATNLQRRLRRENKITQHEDDGLYIISSKRLQVFGKCFQNDVEIFSSYHKKQTEPLVSPERNAGSSKKKFQAMVYTKTEK